MTLSTENYIPPQTTGLWAGKLARGVLPEQGEKANLTRLMQLDMIARVEGFLKLTQGSLSGRCRRSVTTWTTFIKSASTFLRQRHELS